MGQIIRFERTRSTQGILSDDVCARLRRKLKMIRPDLRPDLEQTLEQFVDHLLAKQAVRLSRGQ